MERKNVWTNYGKKELEELEKLNKNYRHFLDHGKTERECVKAAVKQAKKEGFKDLKEVIRSGEKLQAGDCVYDDIYGKSYCPVCHRKQRHGKRNEYPGCPH